MAIVLGVASLTDRPSRGSQCQMLRPPSSHVTRSRRSPSSDSALPSLKHQAESMANAKWTGPLPHAQEPVRRRLASVLIDSPFETGSCRRSPRPHRKPAVRWSIGAAAQQSLVERGCLLADRRNTGHVSENSLNPHCHRMSSIAWRWTNVVTSSDPVPHGAVRVPPPFCDWCVPSAPLGSEMVALGPRKNLSSMACLPFAGSDSGRNCTPVTGCVRCSTGLRSSVVDVVTPVASGRQRGGVMHDRSPVNGSAPERRGQLEDTAAFVRDN